MAEQVNEAFSNISYMDVDELRSLYYGRQDLFVSFTDSWKFELSGMIDGELERPYGVLSYSVENIVGRNKLTNRFYGFVHRFSDTSGTLQTNTYNQTSFENDMNILREFGLPVDDALEATKTRVGITHFEQLWRVTQFLSQNRTSDRDLYWAQLFSLLGYTSLSDVNGRDLFGNSRTPAMLILDIGNIERIDIMPVQKYRVDHRQNVTDMINRRNVRMHPTRNRIAKKRTSEDRSHIPTSQILGLSPQEVRALLLGVDV